VDTANQYQVYVLRNPQGRFYIGLSESVFVRLKQHNSAMSQWTSSRGPWSLVWTSGFLSLGDARRLEIRLKKAKGGRGFFSLTGLQRSSGS